MSLLKNLVSKSQLKKAKLTGNETVEALNPWAKGQKGHKSNDTRRIYDENYPTPYVVKSDKRGKEGYIIECTQ